MSLDLEALSAMETAATRGWTEHGVYQQLRHWAKQLGEDFGNPGPTSSDADARLIATARNALPELLRMARAWEATMVAFNGWNRHQLDEEHFAMAIANALNEYRRRTGGSK